MRVTARVCVCVCVPCVGTVVGACVDYDGSHFVATLMTGPRRTGPPPPLPPTGALSFSLAAGTNARARDVDPILRRGARARVCVSRTIDPAASSSPPPRAAKQLPDERTADGPQDENKNKH